MSLRKLLCHWQPASTTGHNRYDLPSTLSLRIAQEMWSVSDVKINIASVRPATTLCSAHAHTCCTHARTQSSMRTCTTIAPTVPMHRCCLTEYRTHRRRSVRYCAASHACRSAGARPRGQSDHFKAGDDGDRAWRRVSRRSTRNPAPSAELATRKSLGDASREVGMAGCAWRMGNALRS